jgi:SNF2 family DNA or RNA helicase
MTTPKKLLTPENLREYQCLINAHQIDVPRSATFAGMGLGKTASTLTTLDSLILAGESSPTLILAPLRVAKLVWGDEAKKWSHLKHLSVVPIVGSEKERLQALRYDSQVFTTNYESLPWLVEHFGSRWPFKNVVMDESSKTKSFRLRQGGVRMAALGKVAHTQIKRVMQLTGTPAPNGLKDLWGSTWMLDRGNRLGRTFDAFTSRWFKPSPDGYGSVALPHAQAEIQELLKDICITIRAEDYFDLKEPIVRDIVVDLPKKAMEMYASMEKDFFMQLACGTEVEAFNSAAKSMKLLQICSGAAYVDPAVGDDQHPKAREFRVIHDEKLDALDDILEEAGGSPVMISYQFKSDAARIKKRYPDAQLLSNDAQLAAFKTGKFRIGYGHAASMGHGIDQLQNHCYTMVNFSLGWNLEQAEQMLGRIGPVRQFQAGFNRNVFVYNIIARGTIDEVVAERLVSKASVQNALLDAMKRHKTS